jgi:hypothetical protein
VPILYLPKVTKPYLNGERQKTLSPRDICIYTEDLTFGELEADHTATGTFLAQYEYMESRSITLRCIISYQMGRLNIDSIIH